VHVSQLTMIQCTFIPHLFYEGIMAVLKWHKPCICSPWRNCNSAPMHVLLHVLLAHLPTLIQILNYVKMLTIIIGYDSISFSNAIAKLFHVTLHYTLQAIEICTYLSEITKIFSCVDFVIFSPCSHVSVVHTSYELVNHLSLFL